MQLLPFSPNAVFLAQHATEDKIDLRLGSWEVHNLSSDLEIQTFKEMLASPSGGAPYVSLGGINGDAHHGTFFLRPATKGFKARRLYIRTNRMIMAGPEADHEAPLCGGYCQFSRFYYSKMGGGIDDGHFQKLHLDLSLNLQRFMRHQPVDDDPAEGALDGTPHLRKRGDDRSCHGKEFSFDGSDNWIPNTPSWKKYASPKASRSQFEYYLAQIRKQIEDELTRACKVAKSVHHIVSNWNAGSPYYSLSKVETFWEFPSANPIFEVMRLGGRLLHLKKDWGRARTYRFSFKEAGRNFNSPCFTIPISENTELKLYAKTNRRIRIEISHLLHKKQQRTALLREVGIKADKEQFSLSELSFLLKALRERGAKKLNDLMKELQTSESFDVTALSVVDLLSEITAGLPVELSENDRRSQIQMILFQICYQGGFRGNSKTGPFASVIEHLRIRKVLKWNPSNRFYVLHDDYRMAKEALNSITGDPFLALLGGEITPDGFHKFGNRYVHLRE